MIQPKVSVITVVRNCRETIGATVENVLAQTYRNLEYLVIDGASTDGTTEIIRNYQKQITKFISEPDKGIADAFNNGAIKSILR